MDTIESKHVQVDSEEDVVEVKSSDTIIKNDLKNKGNKTIHISGKNFKRQRRLTSGKNLLNMKRLGDYLVI